MTLLDNLVEDCADEAPCGVGHGGRGRNESGSTEDDGSVDVPEVALGPLASSNVDDYWETGTEKEEPHHRVVKTTATKQSTWSDDSPDDRGGKEHMCVGARVVVCLMRCAHAFNGAKSPVVNGDLDNAGPDGRDELRPESCALRYLHVMREFDVLSEVKTLITCDVAVHLEHHHCQGAPGLHISNDELGNDVQSKLDVCGCLDNADREVEED